MSATFFAGALIWTFSLNGKPVDIPVTSDMLNGIWQEVVCQTGVPENTPVPQIWHITGRVPDDEGKLFSVLANYFATERFIFSDSQEIEVYHDNFQTHINRYDDGLACEDVEARLYYTLAHELIHHALYKLRIPMRTHHQCMKKSRYLNNVMQGIDRMLGIKNPAAQEMALRSVDAGIYLDLQELNRPRLISTKSY